MKKKNWGGKKFVFGIMAVLLTAVTAKLSVLAKEEPDVIRVGVYESNGFIALNDEQEMTGYGADFMEKLAEYANIKYEYVRLTWKECMEGLLTGDIDIVTDARQTAERQELYDFSVQCIGQIQAAIFVPAGTEDIYFNDYEAMSKLKVGFEENAMNKVLYEDFARQHGFVANTVEYPDNSDLRAAMKRGEIDAFGGETHTYTDDLKVISIYNTSPNYIMSKKDSPIMKRLNLAIEEMYTQNPDMFAEQYTYLAGRQLYGEILLTREESEYIAANPVLRVATYTDRKPASWYDEETGTFQGIAISMMEQLSEITGFQFEYVPVDEGVSAAEMLLKDDVDLAMPTVPIEYYTGTCPIRVTKPLYTLSVAMAFKNKTRLSDEEKITVAVAKSNEGVRAMLEHYFPNLDIKRYNTAQDCINALKRGEVDAYGNAMYELEYRLKSPQNNRLRIAYSYSCPIDYSISMRADEPEELYHILNSGISLIPQSEADRIIRYYSTFLKYNKSASDWLYENHVLLISILLLLIFMVVAWVMYDKIQKKSMAAISLKNEEAELAAQEARHANAAKSDFLARMSHDMRTPMNGILGLIELNKDAQMPDNIRDMLGKITIEGNFLLSLINDTLDMTKIDSNKLTLNEQPTDLEKLLKETLTLIETYAKEKSVACVIRRKNIPKGVIKVDKLRVQQLVLNILSNAVKFSHKGGTVEFDVECYEEDENVYKTRFVVADHGIGMSEEFLMKVFEPFEQEQRVNLSDVHEGTGLGLTITKRLLDMMGGHIKIDSRLNEGTTVTVYLNFEKSEQEEQEAVARVNRHSVTGNERILLCEDNQINTLVAEGLLERQGYIVECAQNGQEGLEKFESSETGYYMLILMDIRMPVMDGMEATRRIRKLDRPDAESIPIVALTANAFEDDIAACLQAGMNAHLAKPLNPQVLYDTLNDFMTE